MSSAVFDFDCAIVGAGVAGAYCLDRLSSEGWRTALFEASNRVGGRLWSLPRRGGGAPAELGGHAISSMHCSVIGLADRFQLTRTPLQFSLAARLLRGVRIEAGVSCEPRDLPYALRQSERGMSAGQLAMAAIAQIEPALATQGFGTTHHRRRALARSLRAVRFEGLSLSQWSFWPLLTRLLSHEAIALSRYCFGSAAAFGDINAYDAIWLLLAECAPEQRHFCLTEGFDALPKALVQSAGAPVFLDHRLQAIAREKDGLRLRFLTPEGPKDVRVRRVILALPQRALVALNIERLVEDSAAVAAWLRAVQPVSACKLFLTYDRAHWPEPAAPSAAVRVAASFTDLPLRQTYAYASHEAGAAGLIMALYADEEEARYWAGLCVGARAQDRGGFEALADDLRPTEMLLREAQAQLQVLHPEVARQEFNGAAFMDWGAAGGAWHAFRPGWQSWRVRERLRRPDPNTPIFICGEAFAELQGWAEGAVNNAEMMLERHFGAGRPAWVDPHYPFEIEGEEE